MSRKLAIMAPAMRSSIVELDKAIYECACSFCGAKSGEACKRRPTTRLLPDTLHASYPHMARIHAGHALIHSRKQTVEPK